jgi:DnaK suppressor protein
MIRRYEPESEYWSGTRTRFSKDDFMNVQHYQQRLLDLEKTLSARTGRAVAEGREEFIDGAHDTGDASVADEVASEQFSEAEQNSAILQQVRDALTRVDAGTFGTCIVDGGPFEAQRLVAVPWTADGLKHERAREVVTPASTPTL